ncbi:hypothetical protein [Bacillus cereus group sp. BfR-BA-01380]|uniref:hypothetical protein n=1 Tax=Bacillus cereus group sp. BfR-BA-01380 TaxID=2920324 RepID=UPI001F57B082|nr:hypothetical protein [Bacillus cereus group sp. BfR-BA-01380]
MAIDFLYFYNWARKKSVRIRRDDISLKRHGMDLKRMNYKFRGRTDAGMVIEMVIKNDKIVSA